MCINLVDHNYFLLKLNATHDYMCIIAFSQLESYY